MVRIIMQLLLFLFAFTYLFPHRGQANPMAVSGGTPMPVLLIIFALLVSLTILGGIGIPGFLQRVIS